MACKENCKKDEAQTQNTQPAEPVAINEQEAEQVTGGVIVITTTGLPGGNDVVAY